MPDQCMEYAMYFVFGESTALFYGTERLLFVRIPPPADDDLHACRSVKEGGNKRLAGVDYRIDSRGRKYRRGLHRSGGCAGGNEGCHRKGGK